MILGLGIDIVHVSRMERWVRVPGLYKRYFHPEELTDALSKGSTSMLSLAARFAAKEAFGKALGTGLRSLKLKDIQVKNNHNGKPDIVLYGTASRAFQAGGGKGLHVTLTHERDNATATPYLLLTQKAK